MSFDTLIFETLSVVWSSPSGKESIWLTANTGAVICKSCGSNLLNYNNFGAKRLLGEKMKETPQQYTERIVSHTQGQDPLKIQAATPKKLQRLLSRATLSKLRKRPTAGKKGGGAEVS